jgi:hypothetical protein
LQIATAHREEISLFLSDVCVTKSDALSVYRRAVANLTIQNGGGQSGAGGCHVILRPGAAFSATRSPCRRPSRGEPDAGGFEDGADGGIA